MGKKIIDFENSCKIKDQGRDRDQEKNIFS